MAAGSLRFVFSKISTLCEKRALFSQYCNSGINPRIKTHWVDLEALPASWISCRVQANGRCWLAGTILSPTLSTMGGWGMEVGSVLSEPHRLSGCGVFPKGKLKGCYKKLGEWKLGGQNQQMFSTVNMILRQLFLRNYLKRTLHMGCDLPGC